MLNKLPIHTTASSKLPRPLWPLGLLFAIGTSYLISKSIKKNQLPVRKL